MTEKKINKKKAKFVKGDIKNLNSYLTLLKNDISLIIHLAAYLNIAEAEKGKYFKNNVGGTLNLVKACGSGVKV